MKPTPLPKTISLAGTPDVAAFLQTVAVLYGTPRKALIHFVRSTEMFQAWRRKVEYCARCQQFVLVVHPDNSGKIKFSDHQRINSEGNVQECEGSGRTTVWSGDRGIHPPEIVRAHIEHLINILHPDTV